MSHDSNSDHTLSVESDKFKTKSCLERNDLCIQRPFKPSSAEISNINSNSSIPFQLTYIKSKRIVICFSATSTIILIRIPALFPPGSRISILFCLVWMWYKNAISISILRTIHYTNGLATGNHPTSTTYIIYCSLFII